MEKKEKTRGNEKYRTIGVEGKCFRPKQNRNTQRGFYMGLYLMTPSGEVPIPDDIVHTYICCVPQEVFPLDIWNAAYPRLNITDGGTEVLVTVSGPRAGNFRVSFYFLYYQNC